jgi:glycosyltransferase involved in cell wall biosynthesis
MKRKLLILGTRGIPAGHGGFETFAERLSLYLVERGWEVTVYCQVNCPKIRKKNWKNINLFHIPSPNNSSLSSIIFDYQSTIHALKEEGIILVLGYNTAIFSILYWLKKRVSIMNMDGMEWWRSKWSFWQKLWLYFNERCGVIFSNHLIADHPQIKKYLKSYVSPRKITVIPYGTEKVTEVDKSWLKPYKIVPNQYVLVIARPEPENSILEIVSAFSSRKWGMKLVILGRYLPQTFSYHQKVMQAASNEVIFAGAIYEKELVDNLRFYALLYIHGHTVGGTNPSLVEALAAGSPVLAQDNAFNRWVAGDNAHYFKNQAHCLRKLKQLLYDTNELERMKLASAVRYWERFSENRDLKAYEKLLSAYIAKEEFLTVSSKSNHKN